MPTYEYECRKCEKQFKVFYRTLLRGDEKIECPHCQSQNVERRVSRFSLGGFFDSHDSSCGSSSGFS